MSTNENEAFGCCSMHDTDGRRGIWWRRTPGTIEVCAGREGDDWHVKLSVGDVLTERTIESLGNHGAAKAVGPLKKFLTHENKQVRSRTKLAIDSIEKETSHKR